MSVEIWRDPMTGSACLRNGGVKVKLDPMVADAFAELQSSMSALGTEQMRRLLEKELGKSKSLGAMNSKLREQLQDAERDESCAWDRVRKAEAENAKLRELALVLLLNLRNREAILELSGLPPTEAQKAAMASILETCNELGVEGADEWEH